jgi:HSP20 family protein
MIYIKLYNLVESISPAEEAGQKPLHKEAVAMTSLAWLEPFAELAQLRRSMDRWFEDAFGPTLSTGASRYLGLNVYETPENVVVKADLPGVKPGDVEITIEQGTLTIRAKREEQLEESDARWHIRELWAGEYVRSLVLPNTVEGEKAKAAFDHGMLTLTVPKREAAKAKKINISVNGK